MNRQVTYSVVLTLVLISATIALPADAKSDFLDLQRWTSGAITTPTQTSISRVKAIIGTEAEALDVPVPLALAVAKVESNFDTAAVSSAGARGVMQILPRTARQVYGVEADRLWDMHVNVHLGLRYLRDLYEQYDQDWTLALSHYNGGTISSRFYRPHVYTREYVDQVLQWADHYAGSQGPFSPATVRTASRLFNAPDLTSGFDRRNDAEPWSAVRAREIAALRARFRDSLWRLDRR